MSSKKHSLWAVAALAFAGGASAAQTVEDLASLASEVRAAQLKAQLAEAQLAEKKAREAAEAKPEPAKPAEPAMAPFYPSQAISAWRGPEGVPGAPGAPAASGSTPAAKTEKKAEEKPDDIRLMAVYGMDDSLRAEIFYNSRTVMASMTGNTQIGPWTITEITPYKVSLSKKGSKGENRDVYMGTENIDLYARPVQEQPIEASVVPPYGTGAYAGPVPVPPMQQFR